MWRSKRSTGRPESRLPQPKKAKGKTEENWDGLEEKSLEGAGFGICPPLNPRTYLAEDGIICEQDVPVTLRDGIVIYTDIYRPVGQTNIPAIVSWSYFGKRPGDGFDEWQIIGVPPGTVSRMTKFESPDPGYWCRHGYAVANVDPRGVGHSEGDINMFGTQDGRDGYDFVEWLATQHWCNGKVGMGGNSGVAMTQWRIAAEQPPHLVCIAPWEGTGDLYRESLYEGGIPALGFNDFIVGSLIGNGYVDDNVAMAMEYPFLNAYWEDKIPKWQNIRIPTYTTVCWNHFHLRGSMEGFRKIRSTKKWLRAHREFEWPDTYCTCRPGGPEALLRPLSERHPQRMGAYPEGPARGHGRLRVRLSDEPSGKGISPCQDPVRETLRRCGQRRPFLRSGSREIEGQLRGRDGFDDLRHQVRRRHGDHRLHEAPPVGRGRGQRRHGPVHCDPEAG